MKALVRFQTHARPHFCLGGLGFESTFDLERSFSVLSIPDDVTRHSLLHGGWRWEGVKGFKRRTDTNGISNIRIGPHGGVGHYAVLTVLTQHEFSAFLMNAKVSGTQKQKQKQKQRTHFFSSSLERTKRVKFFSSMKPMSSAIAPPTAEAMMIVSVLSTSRTAENKGVTLCHIHQCKSRYRRIKG